MAAPGEWKRRESLGSALVQIAVVGVMLALAVYWVYRRGSSRQELVEAVRSARATAQRGNFPDLLAGAEAADRARALDDGAPEPAALSAALWTELWWRHQHEGAEARARSALQRAQGLGSRSDDRYGTEVLHLVLDGKPPDAVALVESLRQRGGSGPRLSAAHSRALRAVGNLPLARVAATAAADAAWRDGNLTCDAAELALEGGLPGGMDSLVRLRVSSPGLVCVRLVMGLGRVLRGDNLAEAEGLVSEVRTLAEASGPQQALAHAVVGAVRLAQGRLDDAAAEVKAAVGKDPDQPWARFVEARLLAARRDPAAGAAYAALTRAHPSIPVFAFEGALDLQAAGRTQEATALLDGYAAFYREVKNETAEGTVQGYLDRDDRYWLARGELLRAAERPRDALEALDTAIAIKGAVASRAIAAKGALLAARNDLDQALTLLKDITPSDGSGPVPEAYLTVGDILFAKRAYPAGCESYAFALARLRAARADPARLVELRERVERQLKDARQTELARVWVDETKGLVAR